MICILSHQPFDGEFMLTQIQSKIKQTHKTQTFDWILDEIELNGSAIF